MITGKHKRIQNELAHEVDTLKVKYHDLDSLISQMFHELSVPLLNATDTLELIKDRKSGIAMNSKDEKLFDKLSSYVLRIESTINSIGSIYEYKAYQSNEIKSKDYKENSNLNTLVQQSVIQFKILESGADQITFHILFQKRININCYPTQVMKLITLILEDLYGRDCKEIWLKTNIYNIDSSQGQPTLKIGFHEQKNDEEYLTKHLAEIKHGAEHCRAIITSQSTDSNLYSSYTLTFEDEIQK